MGIHKKARTGVAIGIALRECGSVAVTGGGGCPSAATAVLGGIGYTTNSTVNTVNNAIDLDKCWKALQECLSGGGGGGGGR